MDKWIRNELRRSFARAKKAGDRALATEPRAANAYYDRRKARLVVELTNGVILMLPPRLLQGLQAATPAQIANVELSPLGTALHWPDLDADLGIAGLANGAFGNKTWMSELARYAGSHTSPRKAASARANGKKGGRPRTRKPSSTAKHRDRPSAP